MTLARSPALFQPMGEWRPGDRFSKMSDRADFKKAWDADVGKLSKSQIDEWQYFTKNAHHAAALDETWAESFAWAVTGRGASRYLVEGKSFESTFPNSRAVVLKHVDELIKKERGG